MTENTVVEATKWSSYISWTNLESATATESFLEYSKIFSKADDVKPQLKILFGLKLRPVHWAQISSQKLKTLEFAKNFSDCKSKRCHSIQTFELLDTTVRDFPHLYTYITTVV